MNWHMEHWERGPLWRINTREKSYIAEYIPAVISVSIYPGAIALTRIPVGPNSAARALVRPEI
jgi:hypothetical protein